MGAGSDTHDRAVVVAGGQSQDATLIWVGPLEGASWSTLSFGARLC